MTYISKTASNTQIEMSLYHPTKKFYSTKKKNEILLEKQKI